MATDYDAPRTPPEDTETASLEVLRSARDDRSTGTVDVDEVDADESFVLPGADLSGEELTVEVRPVQGDEFTCTSCFLVHHRSQLVTTSPPVCSECAA